LAATEARDTSRLGDKIFDVIIINSVAQYFPDVSYLEQVLDRLRNHVRPSGVIYIGDIRNLDWAPLFYTEVLIHKAKEPLAASTIHRGIARAAADETELLISPEFFLRSMRAKHYVTSTEIHMKRGYEANELFSYRYDAVLYINDHRRPVPISNTYRWGADIKGLEDVIRHIDKGIPSFVITRIPDLRVSAVAHVFDSVQEGDAGTGYSYSLTNTFAHGVSIEDIYRLAEQVGYHVQTRPSGIKIGAFDALYSRLSSTVRHAFEFPRSNSGDQPNDKGTPANCPEHAISRGRLSMEVLSFAKSLLPAYMVPAHLSIISEFPVTPSGKIDRKALPSPAMSHAARTAEPVDPTGELLCVIIKGILGIEYISLDEDFVQIGGDSIKAVLVSANARRAGLDLSIQDLLAGKSIRYIASLVAERNFSSNDYDVDDEPVLALDNNEIERLESQWLLLPEDRE
jgi:aryl carrier-like protein